MNVSWSSDPANGRCHRAPERPSTSHNATPARCTGRRHPRRKAGRNARQERVNERTMRLLSALICRHEAAFAAPAETCYGSATWAATGSDRALTTHSYPSTPGGVKPRPRLLSSTSAERPPAVAGSTARAVARPAQRTT